ncbi:Crp/Fnr family transcriptional regulator [Tenacibaculum sp. 190524A02b]|uniref:Crp/Fnr family transcriptional regulator n=1 Tax=Tenacibaculum vairaonense TaxID=3137860 RepID=UPI0031FA547B
MILETLINCKETTARLIKSNAITRKYKVGDPILLKDVPVNHTAIILKGVLKAHLDQENNSLLLYHITPNINPIIAVMDMTEVAAAPISVTAIEESVLLWIPDDKFGEAEINTIPIKKAVIQSSEHNLKQMLYNLKSLMTHTLENRLFDYLKNKASIYQQKDIHISRTEISLDLKVPLASISRAIKRLENQHKVIGKPRSILLVA